MFRAFVSLIALSVGYNVLQGNTEPSNFSIDISFYINHILEFVRNILTQGF